MCVFQASVSERLESVEALAKRIKVEMQMNINIISNIRTHKKYEKNVRRGAGRRLGRAAREAAGGPDGSPRAARGQISKTNKTTPRQQKTYAVGA